MPIKPWSDQKEKLLMMTWKSISGLSGLSPGDHAGYRDAPLDAGP